MNKNKATSVPLGVLLISGFYTFGAIVLLVFLFVNPQTAATQIALRHGLPASTGNWILPLIAGVGLLIAYGLVSLSRWGYWLSIAYLLYFGVVNFYMSGASWVSVYCGDSIWSFLVIAYLIIARKRFFGTVKVEPTQIQA